MNHPLLNFNKKLTRLTIVWLSLLLLGLLIMSQFLNSYEIQLQAILKPPEPNISGLFGYDELGRSILFRLLQGIYPALTIASMVVLITMVFGVTIGLISAYFQGVIDSIIVRIMDIFLAFPGLLLAIVLAGILGPGISNVVIALSVVGWIGFARLTRAQVLVLKNNDFVTSAIATAQPLRRILFIHLLPLISGPLMVEATFAFATSILAEAGLSFLGLGIQPPDPSWGQMIRTGAQYMLIAPHMVIIPSLALWLSILLINQLGERLQQKISNKISA